MYRSSGPSSLRHKVWAITIALSAASPAQAFEPAVSLDAAWLEEALAEHVVVDQAWSVPAWSQAQGVELQRLMDEQIFTELSPILESSEPIRLPADQLLTD